MLLLNDVCGVEYMIFELTKKKKKQLTWFIDFPCSFCKYSYATFNLEAKHEQHKKFKRKLNLKGMNLTIRPKLLQYISHLQSNVRESTKKRVFLFFCVYNKYELTCFVDPASLCLQATISALCVTALCTSYFWMSFLVAQMPEVKFICYHSVLRVQVSLPRCCVYTVWPAEGR